MKILVALDNSYIKDRLDEIYGDRVYTYDISYMEGVIEFISHSKEPYILLTRYGLEGNLTDRMYIKQLRLASKQCRIIYVMEELNNEWKQFLFSHEVFNIIEGKIVSLDAIQENIEQDRSVIYKVMGEEKSSNGEENIVSYSVKNHIIPKQLIAVYGTSGSGKSTMASILAKNLVEKLHIKIALLDMDIQNPSIDILNNIDNPRSDLSQIVEEVDKRDDISQMIHQFMIKDDKNKNLWYLTSNVSLFECQNKLSNHYYQKIYQSVSQKCEYTMVDLPSSPFLDVVPYTLTQASKIFFVINPNYISIRQAMKYLDLMTKLWDIPKDKILILMNKTQVYSLDQAQIKSLLSEYELGVQMPFQREIEGYINGAISYQNTDISLTKICAFLEIKQTIAEEKKRHVSKKKAFFWEKNKIAEDKEVSPNGY